MVELFKTKKSKSNYIFVPDFCGYPVPKAIFNNLETPSLNKFGCPSISSVKNKIYNANSFVDVEIEFGLKDDEPYYNYVINEKSMQINNNVHTLIKSLIVLQYENNVINLQLLAPYAFVTDDKELEFTTVMPNMKTENCTYIHGGFKPYYWVRSFNSSWTLKDISKPGKLYFDINNPFISVVFNKSVELEYMEVTEKIKNYFDQSFRVNGIRKNLNQIYNNAKSRRPKGLLDK
jgi:hypothetical protein